MKLSIIIPAYNEYFALKKFFDAFLDILCQKNIEVLVVLSTNNSDETHTITSAKVVHSPFHSRAAQMNLGAQMARGDVLMFLHADVLPPSSFYIDIKNTIDKGFEFGFFAYQFNPTSFMLNINAFFTRRDGILAGGGDQIHFMTASLFNKMNGYDAKMDIMEDFDFMRRIKKLGKPYTIVQNQAMVSSRKYHKRSWLRVNFANLVAFTMFSLKVDSLKIKKIYNGILG